MFLSIKEKEYKDLRVRKQVVFRVQGSPIVKAFFSGFFNVTRGVSRVDSKVNADGTLSPVGSRMEFISTAS